MARDFVWIGTSRSGPSACNRRRHHPGWNRSTSERLRPLESTQNKYLGPRCHTAIENRQQNRKKKARTQASILLLNFHPNLLRISITVISKRRQFFFRAFSSSSLESSDQHFVWYVPLKVTCKKELGLVFLNPTSFLLNQIALQRADAPIRIWFRNFQEKLLSQEPKRFDTLEGGWIPKVIYCIPNEPCDMSFKNKVLYGFIAAAERTFGAALPFSLHQVVFRQVSHLRRTDPPQILLKETRSGCRQEEEAYVGANLRPTHEMH